MTPENAERYMEILLAIIMGEIIVFIILVLAIKLSQSMNPSPEVIEYFRHCNDTCELLS